MLGGFIRNILPLGFILLGCACSTEPMATRGAVVSTKAGGNHVYVASHGWHTGFIIPAAEVREAVPGLKESFQNNGHIEIGWGDKGFYQAKKITAGLAMRAICWPTESVIHAVAVPVSPPEYFPTSELVQLSLNDKDFASLVQFIAASFRRDAEGNIISLGKGLYGDSQFYEGSGSYHLMNTCNKWTAKGICSAGVKISPTFKLTVGSVMDSVKGRPPLERDVKRPSGARR